MELCALVIFSAQTLHLQDIFLLCGRLHTASCQSKLSQVRTHSAPVCGPHDAPQTRHAAVELIATSDEAQVGLFHVQQGRAGIHQQGHFLQLWADLDQRIRGHLKAEMLGVGRPALILHTCTAAHELHIGALCPTLGDECHREPCLRYRTIRTCHGRSNASCLRSFLFNLGQRWS